MTQKKDSLKELQENIITPVGSTTRTEAGVISTGCPLLTGKQVVHSFNEGGELKIHKEKVIETVLGYRTYMPEES